jgi:RNA polymerase sigma-70 factor (ECF subfamily)
VKSKAPVTALGGPSIEKSDERTGEVPDRDGVALLPFEMVPAASLATDASRGDLPIDPSRGAFFSPHAPSSGPRALAIVPTPTRDDLPSDEELVEAIRRGDRELGRAIYKRLIRVIESTLCRVVGRGERDHNDLVQAVFEEVVRTIRSGKFQMRCSLTSWAATLACHVGLNAIRSRRMERTMFDPEPSNDAFERDATATHPERALEARDDLRRLRVALATMTEGRAEAVLLHDVLGYDLAEIAALGGSTVAAVQSRLVRGRRELLEELARVATKAEAGR